MHLSIIRGKGGGNITVFVFYKGIYSMVCITFNYIQTLCPNNQLIKLSYSEINLPFRITLSPAPWPPPTHLLWHLTFLAFKSCRQILGLVFLLEVTSAQLRHFQISFICRAGVQLMHSTLSSKGSWVAFRYWNNRIKSWLLLPVEFYQCQLHDTLKNLVKLWHFVPWYLCN